MPSFHPLEEQEIVDDPVEWTRQELESVYAKLSQLEEDIAILVLVAESSNKILKSFMPFDDPEPRALFDGCQPLVQRPVLLCDLKCLQGSISTAIARGLLNAT